ncbi:hypothetical protein pb186bvf_014316 [Paramecium bursaria]
MGCGQTKKGTHKEIDESKFVVQETSPITEDYTILQIEQLKNCNFLRLGVDKSHNQRFIKIFHLQNLNQNELENFSHTVEQLMKINHLNLIRARQYYYYLQTLYIVQDYQKEGTLLQNLELFHHQTSGTILNVFKQLISALACLHHNRIVHGEIRLEHIMIENKNDYTVKLIDFGISQNIKSKTQNQQIKVTPNHYNFKAPEQFRSSGSFKSDIWAMGVFLYFMITSHMPFQGKDAQSLKNSILRGMINFNPAEWKAVPQIQILVQKMLSVNQDERPTAEQILNDPQIRSVNQQSLKSGKKIVNNLQSYKTINEAQKATLQFIMDNLQTEKEKQELLEKFKKIDVDGNGFISKEELIEVYSKEMKLQAAQQEVDKIFSKIDGNGNGMIDYNGIDYNNVEFIIATCNIEKTLNEDKLKKLFNLLDKDHSGFLSRPELIKILKDLNLSKEKLQSIILEIDHNGDGKITMQEFLKVMVDISK